MGEGGGVSEGNNMSVSVYTAAGVNISPHTYPIPQVHLLVTPTQMQVTQTTLPVKPNPNPNPNPKNNPPTIFPSHPQPQFPSSPN